MPAAPYKVLGRYVGANPQNRNINLYGFDTPNVQEMLFNQITDPNAASYFNALRNLRSQTFTPDELAGWVEARDFDLANRNKQGPLTGYTPGGPIYGPSPTDPRYREYFDRWRNAIREYGLDKRFSMNPTSGTIGLGDRQSLMYNPVTDEGTHYWKGKRGKFGPSIGGINLNDIGKGLVLGGLGYGALNATGALSKFSNLFAKPGTFKPGVSMGAGHGAGTGASIWSGASALPMGGVSAAAAGTSGLPNIIGAGGGIFGNMGGVPGMIKNAWSKIGGGPMGWLSDIFGNFPNVGTNESSSTTTPWAGHAPYLLDVWNNAQEGFQNQENWPGYYQGKTVAGMGEGTQQAFNMLRNPRSWNQRSPNWQQGINTANQLTSGIPTALQGLMGLEDVDPMEAARQGRNFLDPTGTDLLRRVAEGGFLPGQEGGNPFLEDTYNMAADRLKERYQDTVLPGINATFANAGRAYGGAHGTAHGDAATGHMRSLEDLATRIYGDAYRDERGHQMDAAGVLSDQALQAGGLASGIMGDNRSRELSALNAILGGGIQGAGILNDILGQQSSAYRADADRGAGMHRARVSDLLRVGEIQRKIKQQQLDADRAKWEFEHGPNRRQRALDQYAKMILGASPTQSKSESEGWSLG